MTKVKQTFEFATKDGTDVIEFHEWAEQRLDKDEYQAWTDAMKRQDEVLKSANVVADEEGNMIGSENTVKHEQPCDQEWLAFWERYLDETGIEFNTKLEEVND